LWTGDTWNSITQVIKKKETGHFSSDKGEGDDANKRGLTIKTEEQGGSFATGNLHGIGFRRGFSKEPKGIDYYEEKKRKK